MAQGIRHKIEARIILLVMALVFTGCTTVEVPLIPVTNYIPPSSELPLINCKHSVGVSEVIFEDVREKNRGSSEKSYIYATDGLIEVFKKEGLYKPDSPVTIKAYFKSLEQSEEIGFCCTTSPVSKIEYVFTNRVTKKNNIYAFKTECRNESDAVTMNTLSDLYACTIRKNYAALMTELAKATPDNPVCRK